MKKSIYGLMYDDPVRGPVIFYVGCTTDLVRRSQEHARNPFISTHAEYNTYKYRFCRDLADLDIRYHLQVLVREEEITDDSDEYTWILKFARHNEDNAIRFYDDLPLTNMKAGDFLDEMIRDRSVVSAADIREFKQQRELERSVTYERTRDSSNPVARAMLDQIAVELAPARAVEQARKEKKQQRAKRQEQTQAEWLAEQGLLWAEYVLQETSDISLERFAQFKEQK